MKQKPYFRNPERLRALNERFEAGLTTNRQERQLFAAFAPGRPVPPDLEPLRPMMQMYASMAAPATRKSPIAIRWLSAGIAASLLAVVGWGYAGHLRATSQMDEMRRMYAGSYVIRNGVKYTDPAEIIADLHQAERMVTTQSRVARHSPAPVPNPLPAEIDMNDPAVRAVVESALSD